MDARSAEGGGWLGAIGYRMRNVNLAILTEYVLRNRNMSIDAPCTFA